MRWNTNNPKEKTGEIKGFINFALVPTRMTDNTIVWLESYYATKKYYSGHYCQGWITLSREVINEEPHKMR